MKFSTLLLALASTTFVFSADSEIKFSEKDMANDDSYDNSRVQTLNNVS